MMWDVVDLRKNLKKLDEKQAYVKWWAKRQELDLILDKLDVNFDDIKNALDVKDGLYCIYVGQSKDRSVAKYLAMQFNQNSTFRISISSIISLRQFNRESVNNFLDKLKIEIFPIDLPIGSEEAKTELSNNVANCLEKNLYILNIQNNNHPLASDISKKLSELRKEAKINDEKYSKMNEDISQKNSENTLKNIIAEDDKMWFVAAGKDSSKIDIFRNKKVVAIGWNVGDVKGNSKRDIDKKYAENYPDNDAKKKGQAVSQINLFANKVNVGDYIVTSDNNTRQYLLGKCISDYYFTNELDDDIKDKYEHFHDVEWLCSIGWEDISDKANDYIISKSVFEINKIASDEFLDFIKMIPPFQSHEKRNMIYFGAPGTGKSFNLNKKVFELLKDYENNYERVTFHPDYTYANFVGTYKPVPKGKDINYEYVPGPFMRTLVKALKNPFEPFILIIEEINRANVAAVFGEVFQLLDRDKNTNISEFAINASEDMKNYLKEELKNMEIPNKNRCGLRKYWKNLLGHDYDKIKIPSNMFIWATMNSADQGVFPMDTAFKRRWDFKYLGINEGADKIKSIVVEVPESWNIKNNKLSWNNLRVEINKELLRNNINEDKLIGPFFEFKEYMEKDLSFDEFVQIFENKILMYLFEDAARPFRPKFFVKDKEPYLTYSNLCKRFRNEGIVIFNERIQEKFINNSGE